MGAVPTIPSRAIPSRAIPSTLHARSARNVEFVRTRESMQAGESPLGGGTMLDREAMHLRKSANEEESANEEAPAIGGEVPCEGQSLPRGRSLRLLLGTGVALLCSIWMLQRAELHAQDLPRSATPRGVVYTFLTETASSDDSVDRAAFFPRLVGELLHPNPGRFKGFVPPGTTVRIDTIPDLAPSSDGRHHVVAYCRLLSDELHEDLYVFCAGDSIWRMEAIESFPTRNERRQLEESLQTIDTTVENYRRLRADLQRILLSDDSLGGLLKHYESIADRVVPTLAVARKWRLFGLRDVDLLGLDEYRELDDDIDDGNLIFYKVDRESLVALDRQLGIRRIERDPRYPGVIFLVAGEIGERSYGYIYSTSADEIPFPSEQEFVAIKPIASHWWLYKRRSGR